MERALYWFMRIFSIIVAGGAAVLLGLGIFTIITGLVPIAAICFAAGAGCISGVTAMARGCESLKSKF